MKHIAAMMICLVALVMTMPDVTWAKRMGGGKSFGSKPSYSQSFQQSKPPSGAPTRQAAPGAAPSTGRGMLGGMFGGLLLGGLLGSLFFGGPFGGINFMDIVLIGGGLFLLFRFLRSRQPAVQTSQDASSNWNAHNRDMTGNSAWDHMRSSRSTSGGSTSGGSRSVPAGFDTEDFLAGAKTAYVRLQEAWDRRDLDDVRQFTSDEVFAEIKAQATDDPTPGKTEILMVDAQLLDVKTLGNQTIATVLFDTTLREDGPAASAENVREAWHFSRYETGGKGHWVVEGIQQVQ